jgi:hypothetical protein
VIFSKHTLLKAPSARLARDLAFTLHRLASIPPNQRTPAIRDLFEGRLDRANFQRTWERFGQSSRTLRWLCNGLFIYVFIIVPGIIYFVGLNRCWLPLLLCLVTITSSIALHFRRAHSALYPEEHDERFTQSLTILLAPTTAIRALDLLARPLLERFHPLLIASAFCPQELFLTFARRVLLDLRQPALPICPLTDPAAIRMEQFSRETWLLVIEQFLCKTGLDLTDLTRAPVAADDSCHSYCPRCQTQFVWTSGQCADCGGVPLRAVGN